MQKLYKHQEKFVSGYKGTNLLVHEAGTGKTVCACMWLRDGRDNDALVVCPKRVVEKWVRELTTWGAKANVMSKENFKKAKHRRYSAVVIDEADEFASPLFTPQRSQLSESMYMLMKQFPSMPRLLLTATPIRSSPWNLHTLLTLKGHYIDFRKWREAFFTFEKRPYIPRMAWFPNKEWRKDIRKVLEKHADIILLSDCVADIPPTTEEVIQVKNPTFINKEWEGSALFYAEHKHEQKLKSKEIIEIGKGYRKVLVIANYIEQCEQLYDELSKDRETFMIRGGVKDQEDIIRKAQESDECYFIVQASLGAGFDLNTFSCAVFASMSYSVRDWVQMKARIRRIHDLKPVRYIYLIGGRCDKRVRDTILLGKDFVPSEYK